MKKRGSIELTTNFLVVAIISMVVLGLGIVLVKNLTDQSIKAQDTVSDQLKKQIESLLDDGSRVVVPVVSQKATRGDLVTFGIGVRNYDSVAKEFTVKAQTKNGYKPDGTTVISSYDAKVKTSPSSTTFTIQPNAKQPFLIVAQVDKTADRGTYAIDIEVKAESQQYGDPKYRVYVVVE